MNPLDEIINLLPVPQTLFELTWVLIGMQLGKSMGTINQSGMGVDEYITAHGKLRGWGKFVVDRVLHFVHHYWLGLLLIIYDLPLLELQWLGLGLFLEDGSYHLYDFLKGKLSNISFK